jgi:hypothetical protein
MSFVTLHPLVHPLDTSVTKLEDSKRFIVNWVVYVSVCVCVCVCSFAHAQTRGSVGTQKGI